MRHLLSILLVVFCGSVFAQDLIITTSGDSIHCQITDVAPTRLFYSVKLENATVYRRNIRLRQVAMYRREGYFPVFLDVREQPLSNGANARPANRWMLSCTGGLSYRIARFPIDIDQDYRDYLEGQTSGEHLGASLHYFFKESLGVGVVYESFFGAKRSMDIQLRLTDGTIVPGILAEDARMRWIPLSVLYSPRTTNRISFNGWLGIGPLLYTNYATIINKVTLTGATVAYGISLGSDYRLTHALSLGLHATYMIGALDRLEFDFGSTQGTVSLPDRSNESVTRVDLGVVLRLRL
jgi:hypothetical protein